MTGFKMGNSGLGHPPAAAPQPGRGIEAADPGRVQGFYTQLQAPPSLPLQPIQQSLASQTTASFHQVNIPTGQAPTLYFPPPPGIGGQAPLVQYPIPGHAPGQHGASNWYQTPSTQINPNFQRAEHQHHYPALNPQQPYQGYTPSPSSPHHSLIQTPQPTNIYSSAQVLVAATGSYGPPQPVPASARPSFTQAGSDTSTSTSISQNGPYSPPGTAGNYVSSPVGYQPPFSRPSIPSLRTGRSNLMQSKVQGYLNRYNVAQGLPSSSSSAVLPHSTPQTSGTPQNGQQAASSGLPQSTPAQPGPHPSQTMQPPTQYPSLFVQPSDSIDHGCSQQLYIPPSASSASSTSYVPQVPAPASNIPVTHGYTMESSGQTLNSITTPPSMVQTPALFTPEITAGQSTNPPASGPILTTGLAGEPAIQQGTSSAPPPLASPITPVTVQASPSVLVAASNPGQYTNVQPTSSDSSLPPPPESSQTQDLGGIVPPDQQPVPPTLEKEGLFSNLISQLGQIKMSDQPASSNGQTKGELLDDDPPIFTTPMRASGDPDPFWRRCTGSHEVDYEGTWYYLPSHPNFLACSFCYAYHIQNTALGSSFESILKKNGRCRFFPPNMTKALWPTAVRTGDLGPVTEYIARRLDIPDCKGVSGAVMADKVKWYKDKENEIPGFVACEACYNDIILGTMFANQFVESSRQQGANEKWACDVALKYISGALVKETEWARLVSGATKRIKLPKCEGKAVTAHKMKWYRPRRQVENLDFCETCFMDNLALTHLAREFEEVVDADINSKYSSRMCDLNLLNMRDALFSCDRKILSFDSFLTTAKTIAASPRCFEGKGIAGGKWYNLIPEVGNFGVCEGCHAGIIVPHGLAQFWSPKPAQSASDDELFCAFNSRVLRSNEYLNRFMEALETGVWEPYEKYVRKWAPILTCGKYKLVGDRAWYGWHDCTICQDCYETFITGTALSESMPLQNTYLEEQKMCCMYSPRMREKYTAACASGSSEELVAFSRERWAVYGETITISDALRRKANMESEMMAVNMMMSASHSNTDMMNSVWGTGTYGSFGNSAIGYHSTWEGAQSAASWNTAMGNMARANDPGLWNKVAQLEARWKTVE